MDERLTIEPHEIKTVEHRWQTEEDFTLYALYPHMHLRGRSMRFEAIFPGGRRETLLDVPRYDFGWQFRYVLATPRDLPRGTTLVATAVFDNSAANKNNPDPAAHVRSGWQTTDEMFQACFEICRTHEDLVAQRRGRWTSLAVLVLVVSGLGWLYGRWRTVRVAKREPKMQPSG